MQLFLPFTVSNINSDSFLNLSHLMCFKQDDNQIS